MALYSTLESIAQFLHLSEGTASDKWHRIGDIVCECFGLYCRTPTYVTVASHSIPQRFAALYNSTQTTAGLRLGVITVLVLVTSLI